MQLGRYFVSIRLWLTLVVFSVSVPLVRAADEPNISRGGEVSQDFSDISFYKPSPTTKTLINAHAGNELHNVIFMIGDGMGAGQMMLSRIRASGPGGRLYMERLPVTGRVDTYPAGGLVTDSAASATAMACGVKTINGMVGITPEGVPQESLLEAAAGQGMRTGLVVTGAIADATPAAFSAHVKRRDLQPAIAEQQLAQNIHVLLGGGRGHWIPMDVEGSLREDNRNLLEEARKAGYAVIQDRQELLQSQADRVLGLFQVGGLATFAPEPTLEEMAAKAIETLRRGGRNNRGFFLMVEGSKIDSACHRNDADNCVRQTLLFDLAVKAAVDFAIQDGHTLVIVTADHETGGLIVATEEAEAFWTGSSHTAQPVSVLAYGPGAEVFGGVQDNTELSRKTAWLMGLKKWPRALPQSLQERLNISLPDKQRKAAERRGSQPGPSYVSGSFSSAVGVR